MLSKLSKKYGTIYGFRNKNKDVDPDTIKIGSTYSFVKRMCVYKTQERYFNNDTHEIWKFDIIDSKYNCYEIDDAIQKMSIYNKEPYNHFDGDGGIEHYYFDGGIKKLVDFFKKYNITVTFEKIDVKKLREEMKSIDKDDAEKEFYKEKEDKKNELIKKSIDLKEFLNHNNENFKPREDQEIIINESYEYFQKYDKGILILMCGVGKTLISLWLSQKMNMNKILVGVPNILLLEQWEKEIQKVFPDGNILKVKSGVSENDIIEFLKENDNMIVITSYSSCHKVYKATKKINYKFDMKINDECHHLTTESMKEEGTTKTFIEMIHIPSKKQLSLTATIKYLENNNPELNTISNSNIEYFGEIITRRTFLWAIQKPKEILCDYVVQTVLTDEDELKIEMEKLKITDEKDKQLFLSAYTSLKSIQENNSHHLLIYSNNIDNSEKINDYINLLLKEKYFDSDKFSEKEFISNKYENKKLKKFYSSVYHGDMNSSVQEKVIKNFERSHNGIICCVFCLGEGWDFPLLDGVVISENMTANIRIVQSALRASRKNKDEPNKITKIILPVLNKENWLDNNDNNDYRKVREVVYQIGLEDETILTKIKVYKMKIKPNPINPQSQNNKNSNISEFGEYNEEITKQIKLRTIPRYALDTTYEKAKKIISEKMIKIRNKDDYYKVCEIDIRLPKDPEERYKGKFNWIEYLGISNKYYNIDECKEKIDKYLIKYSELKNDFELSKTCKKLCDIDEKFPPFGLWVEYYKIKDLQEIIKIKNSKIKLPFDI
jgi:predicted helicase